MTQKQLFYAHWYSEVQRVFKYKLSEWLTMNFKNTFFFWPCHVLGMPSHIHCSFCCHGNLIFGLVGGSMWLTAARLVVLLENATSWMLAGIWMTLRTSVHTQTRIERVLHITPEWTCHHLHCKCLKCGFAPNHHSKVAIMSSLGRRFLWQSRGSFYAALLNLFLATAGGRQTPRMHWAWGRPRAGCSSASLPQSVCW